MIIPPIIIDIEASGFGKGSYPIEVGYVDRRSQTWCSLITPCEGWVHWSEVAQKLHRIPRNKLLTHGKTAQAVANHLNDTLLNQTIYSDGWLHDFTWLSCLFEAAKVSPHFKLEDLERILSPFQQAAWHATKDNILRELKVTRHRASADAKVLQMTWLKTAQDETLTTV